MAARQSKQRRNRRGKNNVPFIVVAVLFGMAVLIPIVVLVISTILNKSADEKLQKSMYPIKYENYVEKYSEEYGVDICLVYGVIRTESNFDPEAVSSAGAIGLMQLMPDTFLWLQNYRTQFMPDKILDSDELYDPKTNIEYGVYLLRFLLDRYEGNTSLAICAYNAGYGNVDDWLANGTISASNVLAENVPFPETSNYLTKVSSASDVYKELYFTDDTGSYIRESSIAYGESSEEESQSLVDEGSEEYYRNSSEDEYYYDEFYDENAGEDYYPYDEYDYDYSYDE